MQAKLVGIVQTRAGGTQETRLNMAGEAGNKIKAIRKTEIQALASHSKNEEATWYKITTRSLYNELAEHEKMSQR